MMNNNSNKNNKKNNKLTITLNLYFLIPYIVLIVLRAMNFVHYNWFWVITSFLWVPMICIIVLGLLCIGITKAIDYVGKNF